MKIVQGFPADPEGNYQLNMINVMKHAIRNFSRQEIVSRKIDGTLFRYTYRDAYNRMQRLANSLNTLGIKPGDTIGILAWNTYENYEIYLRISFLFVN